MDRQKQANRLPLSLRTKLLKLTSNIPSHHASWISNNTIIVADSQQVTAAISQLFDMSFSIFLKFAELAGCKINRQETTQMQEESTQYFRITLPDESAPPTQHQIILKNLMEVLPKLEQQVPNFEEMSIQVNLRRSENQLFNTEFENQFKDNFLKKFKAHTQSINQFTYNTIYKILVTRNDKKMSPCQVLQLLTELRDRIFENQKQLQECIEIFKERIRSFGTQPSTTIQEQSSGRMIPEQDQEDDGISQQAQERTTLHS